MQLSIHRAITLAALFFVAFSHVDMVALVEMVAGEGVTHKCGCVGTEANECKCACCTQTTSSGGECQITAPGCSPEVPVGFPTALKQLGIVEQFSSSDGFLNEHRFVYPLRARAYECPPFDIFHPPRA
jgi:hypothetical protein